MDKIFLRDLKINAIIGAYEYERRNPQDVIINIVLSTDTRTAAKSDAYTDSIDYDALAHKIRRLTTTAHRQTVEALAEDIAGLCLKEPGAQGVLVRVEKPHAVAGAAGAGVEIERFLAERPTLPPEGI